MPAISVNPPFPLFTDADGQPLDDAYIYIGTANQNPVSNPITVYWDSALTIAAAQPIRTSGGYPVYNGTPARFYTNSDYSILVRDKNGAFIYTAVSETDLIGSQFVTFIQSGSGAVQRTVQDKLRESVSVKDFGSTNSDVEINEAILYLSQGGDGSGSGGQLELARTGYNISEPIKLFNDVRINGTGFNSPMLLSAGANCHMMEVDANRSRIVLDGVWLDGNWATQSGNYRGFNAGSNQIFQWSIKSLYVNDCGGAGFYLESGTALQIDKLDITNCAAGKLEPHAVLPNQTIAQEVSITARSDGNASPVGVRLGSDCSVDHIYLENNGLSVEFRGDGSTVRNAFRNSIPVAAVFNGYGNCFDKITGQGQYSGSFAIQDNGSHNKVPYNELYNKHNTLEILHPGDGVNPYFFDGELHWTGVQRLRNAASIGQQEINIPCQVAAQTNADTASKVVPVLASGEYLVEYWYANAASGNATSMTINDGTSNVLISGSLTDGYNGVSPRWRKYTGLATMGAAATSATMTITSTGTNVGVFANYFTGARMIQSVMPNGGMEGAYVGGVAPNWTSGGTGGTFSETTAPENLRSGSRAQVIVASGGTPTLTSSVIPLQQGVTYLIGGYVKIQTASKTVTAQFQTGDTQLQNIISQITADPLDPWQAFQFVVQYDDQNGGSLNQLRFLVENGTTCYIDDVYAIPLVRAGLENPTRLKFEVPVDLSGAAATRWMSSLSQGAGLYLSHVNLTYTEATSADAGVAINIGKYRASSGTDATFFGTMTSETSKVVYSNTQMKLTRHINGATNANIAISCAGGKTGTGEFFAEIIACPL